MATNTGSSGNDRLLGTIGDDLLIAGGGNDRLFGRGGADIYELLFGPPTGAPAPSYLISESFGGDASVDTITGVGPLVQTSTGGLLDFTTFARVGTTGAHLRIDTAFKNAIYAPSVQSGTITIINQYDPAKPLAQVEKIVAGGIEYNLLITDVSTAQNDIMTGWKFDDTFYAGAGNDYLSGALGRDTLYGEDGDDVILGERGGDYIYGGLGADHMIGGSGVDRIWGGDGNDVLDGGLHWDILRGEDGDDTMLGGAADDLLIGDNGIDTLIGGADDDLLKGGRDRDIYIVSVDNSGNDTIVENGTAPGHFYGWSVYNMDELQIEGFASLDAAIHGIGFQVSGDDLIITYDNGMLPTGQTTIQGQFSDARYPVELLSFGAAIGAPSFHISQLKGDDFTYSQHGEGNVGGEDVVIGTLGDDQIYGGIGNDILFGAGGADSFIFNDEESNGGGTDIILDFDINDDVLDFTEIKTLTRAGVTITENAYGNAVITTGYVTVELDGVAAVDVTDDLFLFL